MSGLNSGRFLDPPEFSVMHDKGNEENVFDRVDYQVTRHDSLHLNLGFSRSWFQTPNSFDAQYATPGRSPRWPAARYCESRGSVGPADQRSQIRTFNVAPSWTHLIGSNAVFTLGAYSCATINTTTIPATIPSRTSAPWICSANPCRSFASSPTPGRARCFLRERHPQHQGRRHLRAHFRHRKRPPRNR